MKILTVLFLLFTANSNFCQTTRILIKDFDGDTKKDTVKIDSDTQRIISLLSTQKFKKVESGKIETLNFGNTLVATKNGFEFWNDVDRSGFKCVFEYNHIAKKLQLIELRRVDDILSYNYGDKSKGMSTVNLLTGKYTGNFYQVINKKLHKIPTINAVMHFPTTYLDDFSDDICLKYAMKCIIYYEKSKKEN